MVSVLPQPWPARRSQSLWAVRRPGGQDSNCEVAGRRTWRGRTRLRLPAAGPGRPGRYGGGTAAKRGRPAGHCCLQHQSQKRCAVTAKIPSCCSRWRSLLLLPRPTTTVRKRSLAAPARELRSESSRFPRPSLHPCFASSLHAPARLKLPLSPHSSPMPLHSPSTPRQLHPHHASAQAGRHGTAKDACMVDRALPASQASREHCQWQQQLAWRAA